MLTVVSILSEAFSRILDFLTILPELSGNSIEIILVAYLSSSIFSEFLDSPKWITASNSPSLRISSEDSVPSSSTDKTREIISISRRPMFEIIFTTSEDSLISRPANGSKPVSRILFSPMV